jgi:hypothetical protein
MKRFKVTSFKNYLEAIEQVAAPEQIFGLYRAQNERKDLLPSIARDNPAYDTTDIEQEMIKELIRRSETILSKNFNDDWDWLVFAQHYGLKTRLLDWTSNPLVALWFACKDEKYLTADSYVYVFLANKKLILDKSKSPTPWTLGKTKILKPSLNNERIIAQSGWFTAHRYSTNEKRFVTLDKMTQFKNLVIEFTIPASLKPDMLKKLNVFGTNNQSVFPDIEGICRHINWEFRH